MSAPGLPLRDIHLPPEPGWWPPAPGWWLLALALGILVLLAGRWMLARLRDRRAARARLTLFESLLHAAGAEPSARVRAANEALRRVVLAESPSALRLSGDQWLSWLDRGLAEAPFSAGAGQLLLDAPYRATVQPEEAERLIELLRRRLREGVS